MDESNPGADAPVSACTFSGCSEFVISTCKDCKLAYCLDHASEVDPQHYCCNCLVPADTEVEEKPLIDKDGVKHAGRVIHPIGRSYRLAEKLVEDMNDVELLDFIEYAKQMVHQLSNMKLHWDIQLGLAEQQAWHNHIGGLAKVGGELRIGTSTQQFKRNVAKAKTQASTAKAKANKPDDLLTALKALGMTPEEIIKLVSSVKKG